MNTFESEPYKKILTTKIKEEMKKDNFYWYLFEDTVFYPGGGGQSADSGTVNNVPLKGIKQEKNKIWHLLGTQIDNPVEQKLDWDYRYQNMQQHSGQHVISAVFNMLFGAVTLSVHLGENETMIEFNHELFSELELLQAEKKCNEVIRNAVPVKAQFEGRDEAQKRLLRRSLKKDDDVVRLIEIENLDLVGCGGTHVKNTSEIGLIKITGQEKIRSHSRIKALIGDGAYQYFDQLDKISQAIVNRLTCNYQELHERVDALLDEQKELQKEIKKYADRWMAELLSRFENEKYLYVGYLPGMSSLDLKRLSEMISEKKAISCFLFSRIQNKYLFVFRSADEKKLNTSEFIVKFGSKYDIKGGGSADFSQGIILKKEINEDYMHHLKTEIQNYMG